MKIAGIANLDGTKIPCVGIISILKLNEKQAYISWKIESLDGNLIASVTKNYFNNNLSLSERQWAEIVVADILNYRIERKKVFADVKFVH